MNMNYNNICLQDQKLRIALILISEKQVDICKSSVRSFPWLVHIVTV